MPQLFDVFGNEATPLDAVNGSVITDPRPVTSTLSTINSEVVVDCSGHGVVAVDLRSPSFAGTVEVQGSVDGVIFFALPVYLYGSNIAVPTLVLSAAVSVSGRASCVGLRKVRVRVVTAPTGSLFVSMRASRSTLSINVPLSTSLHFTATAALGVLLTATIPAVVGFAHVFSRLQVQRFFGAAGLAAATPTIVTTNLPGSRALSFGTSGAIGTMLGEQLVGLLPIRAAAVGATTTVSCPAVADTIWRVSADYTLAP